MDRDREFASHSPAAGIGPVEAVGPGGSSGPGDQDAPEPGPGEQLWSPGGSRPGEWWAGLPLGRRRLVSAAAALALAAGGLGYLAATRPEPPPPPEPVPAPWPTNVTSVAYEGLDSPVDGGATFTVHMSIEVAATGRFPVTVVEVGQEYSSLTTETVPSTPITVKPGESRRLAMIVRVRDCARTPIFAGMPLVKVTLRNTRAIRTRSEIFGERYAHALSTALSTLCPTVAKQSTQLSTP